MNELDIKTHNFELAKNGLKEFSQKEASELEIATVQTEGGFLMLGNHKVTGIELNTALSTIQGHLIDLNNLNNRTIKEFGQVYNALEALDKEYINGILISIKSTEKTSESVQVAQEQIKKVVEGQKKTLQILKKFKEKIDGYAHIEDIDKIWNECQYSFNQINRLSNSISDVTEISKINQQKVENLKAIVKSTEKNSNDLADQLNQQNVKFEDITNFISQLEQQTYETTKLVQVNIEKSETITKELNKKIKYAYLLAILALGIAIIGLIVITSR